MQSTTNKDFIMDTQTANLCNVVGAEFDTLSIERIAGEWMKLVTKGQKPSAGLRVLVQTNWVRFFPHIEALIDCPQDAQWHPEGDVFIHTCFVMDAAANIATREGLNDDDRAVLVLAALCHDFAKPSCTRTEWKANAGRMAITSSGHEEAGGPMAEAFLKSIGVNQAIIAKVVPLVANHLRHIDFIDGGSPRAIRRLAQRLEPSNVSMLALLVEADTSGRPPLPVGMPIGAVNMLAAASAHKVTNHAQKPLLKGRHLIEMGLKPSPEFGRIINEVFQLQLDGVLNTEQEALEFCKTLI